MEGKSAQLAALAAQIRALDVWTAPAAAPGGERALAAQIDELRARVAAARAQLQRDAAAGAADALARYDRTSADFADLTDFQLYAYATGVVHKNELLRDYFGVRHQLELSHQAEQMLAQLAVAEHQAKCSAYEPCYQSLVDIMAVVPGYALAGFKSYAFDYVTAIAESLKVLLTQDLVAVTSFRRCTELLDLSYRFDALLNRPPQETQLASAAHHLWFDVEKWRTSAPPDSIWLDEEGTYTAAAIYQAWEPLAGERFADALATAGLQELFFRYLSFRSQSEDWVSRSRTFLGKVLGLAGETVEGAWHGLAVAGVRKAWTETVSSDELVSMARSDATRLSQMLPQAETEAVPVQGMFVDVMAVKALALLVEVVTKMVLFLEGEDESRYLTIVARNGIIESVVNDIKSRWNKMDDAMAMDTSLGNSIAMLNALFYISSSVEEKLPAITPAMLEPVTFLRTRVVNVFANSVLEPASAKQLATDPHAVEACLDAPLTKRVQNELFLDAVSAVLAALIDALLASTPPAHPANLAAVETYASRTVPPNKRDLRLQNALTRLQSPSKLSH